MFLHYSSDACHEYMWRRGEKDRPTSEVQIRCKKKVYRNTTFAFPMLKKQTFTKMQRLVSDETLPEAKLLETTKTFR